MKNILLILFVTISLTACHTIHIKNGEMAHRNYETENFHHIVALRLAEVSEPVNPNKICEKGWDSVRTRTGPIQVLVGLVVGGFYNPEEVAVSCK